MTDEFEHLREKAERSWREVMLFPGMPPAEPGSFGDLTSTLVMGHLWNRSVISNRERRLITLTVLAGLGRDDILAIHLGAAIKSGDLSAADLEEMVIHVAFYAGWPRAAALHIAVRKALAEAEQSG